MSKTERDYAANYRKPSLHTRFRKEQSGNPRGRGRGESVGGPVRMAPPPCRDGRVSREKTDPSPRGIQEKGLHRPFPFDLERAAGLEAERVAQCLAGRGGDVDAAGQTVGFHAPCGIYGIAPDIVGDL
jgi:hypothetical protein